MYILGISCYYHDAAAALLKDGMLIAAAEEERFTRKKHDSGFPNKAIEFCLAQAGITTHDLDYAVFYEKPLLKYERILMTNLATYPTGWRVFTESMLSWFNEKLWIKTEILDKLHLPPDNLLFVEHHLSHAASAFFCSPYNESAILTVDGVGEWTTTTVGKAIANWNGINENNISLFSDIRFPHSLGLLYSAFTAWLGFEVNDGEYKVMGMAPFGEPKYAEDVYKMIDVAPDGSFRLRMEYFDFHHSTHRTYSNKFLDVFGKERKHESEFFTGKTHPDRRGETKAKENQRYADIAASIQVVTEEVLLKMAAHAHKVTGSRKLCIAGGVGLNSVANGRLVTETPFEDIYIQPAAGDSGGAVGAALYAYHVILGQPRKFVMEHAYWGKGYSSDEIKNFLDKESIAYERIENEESLLDQVVDTITQGRVVGWMQGRFEWGPRALGNRSILADPTRSEMKDIVNTKIKFREPFRPFAPVVLEEKSAEYFKLDQPHRHYPARYMLLVADIPHDKQTSIPAVTHVNGTGRLQTIKRETNPRYYRVVEKFGERTGVPVLLNTSFNLRGEPIVNTPANAFSTFSRSDIDILVMENFVVRKRN